jgi:hypothetical protein
VNWLPGNKETAFQRQNFGIGPLKGQFVLIRENVVDIQGFLDNIQANINGTWSSYLKNLQYPKTVISEIWNQAEKLPELAEYLFNTEKKRIAMGGLLVKEGLPFHLKQHELLESIVEIERKLASLGLIVKNKETENVMIMRGNKLIMGILMNLPSMEIITPKDVLNGYLIPVNYGQVFALYAINRVSHGPLLDVSTWDLQEILRSSLQGDKIEKGLNCQ